MFSRSLWAATLRREEKAPSNTLAGAIGTAIVGIAMSYGVVPLRAEDTGSKINKDVIDTEDLFGFIEGSDVGALGQKEIEAELDDSGRQTDWIFQ